MDRSKTFIPKGNYNKTPHIGTNSTIDSLDVRGNYGDAQPIDMLHPNQIYQPSFSKEHVISDNTSHTNKEFNYGDVYNPPHGSNHGGYGKPIHPYTQYDMLDSDVTQLFKEIDNMPHNKKLVKRTTDSVIENTHNNNLSKKDQYGLDRSIIPDKFTDQKKLDLLDMNIKGIRDHVVEHTLYLNSNNRDTANYPNPFNYRIDFNPVSGNSNAYIGRLFKNVKYIDIKNVTMPRKYYINKSEMTIQNATTPGDMNEFVTTFINTNINGIISYPYILHHAEITQGTTNIKYYIFFYEIIMAIDTYILTKYTIYLNNDMTNAVNISIDSGASNTSIINAYIAAYIGASLPNVIPVGAIYTYTGQELTVTDNIKYLAIVDKQTTTKTIKYTWTNDIFEDIIDRTYEFTYDGTPGIYTINDNIILEYLLNSRSLENDRYILLNIEELDSKYEYTTDQHINNNFSMLLPDYINGDYYYLNTNYQDKFYDRGVLGNIKRLTIKFKSSNNNDLKISNSNYIDYDITTPNDRCICTYDPDTGDRIRDYTCSHSYLRHGGYEKLQNTIMMRLGVVEGFQDVLELQA